MESEAPGGLWEGERRGAPGHRRTYASLVSSHDSEAAHRQSRSARALPSAASSTSAHPLISPGSPPAGTARRDARRLDRLALHHRSPGSILPAGPSSPPAQLPIPPAPRPSSHPSQAPIPPRAGPPTSRQGRRSLSGAEAGRGSERAWSQQGERAAGGRRKTAHSSGGRGSRFRNGAGRAEEAPEARRPALHITRPDSPPGRREGALGRGRASPPAPPGAGAAAARGGLGGASGGGRHRRSLA